MWPKLPQQLSPSSNVLSFCASILLSLISISGITASKVGVSWLRHCFKFQVATKVKKVEKNLNI
jgi:hypothetical protein